MKTEYKLLVDWLTITGVFESWNDIYRFLGLDECKLFINNLKPSYMQYYDTGYHLMLDGMSAISISMGHNVNKDKSIIVLRGKGCRFFESYSKLSFEELFHNIAITPNISVSRIDIAFDIKSEKYSMEPFMNAYRTKQYVSRASHVSGYDSQDNYKYSGSTLYFGKRSSNTQLCIYDKGSERGFRKNDLELDWIRIELRLRRKYAAAFILDLVSKHYDISELYFGVLTRFVRFVDENPTDSNKRRWSISSWWSELTNFSKPIKLSEPGVVYDVKATENNIERQVASRVMFWFELNPDKSLKDFINKCKAQGAHFNSKQSILLQMFQDDIWSIDNQEETTIDDDFVMIYDYDLTDDYTDDG